MAGRGWSTETVVAEYRDLQATAMAVDCTGQYAVLAGRKQLAIVNLDDPLEQIKRISRQSKYEVSVVQWNPHFSHKDIFITASNQRAEISVWQDDQLVPQGSLRAHTRAISDLDWSAFDPNNLATCSVDTYIYLWDVRDTRKPTISLSAVAGASQVKWNKISSNFLASAHDGDVRIWDQRKGTTPVQYIAAHLSKIYGLDWSPVQEYSLATCSQDYNVKLWDVCNPRKAEHTISSGAPVWRARFIPFGQGLVTVVVPQLRRGDNSLLLWNVTDSTAPVHTFVGHTDVILEFQWRKSEEAADFQLVTWSKDQSLRIWKIEPHLQKLCGYDTQNDSGNELETPGIIDMVSESGAETLSVASRDFKETDGTPFSATPPSTPKVVTDAPSLGQPKTLQQEFALVNMHIDNVIFGNMDAAKGTCTVMASSGKYNVKLQLTFPPTYPNNAAPSFQFLKSTTVDNVTKSKLLKVLRETSAQHVKKNRTCLEPCLRQLIATLDGIMSKDSDNSESGSPYRQPIVSQVGRVSSFSSYAYGFQDTTVPFPRTSGARFSKTGVLVCFSRPSGFTRVPGAEMTPRALSALAAFVTQHPISVPAPASIYQPSARSPSKDDRISISSFYFETQRMRGKMKKRQQREASPTKIECKCGSVVLYDAAKLEPVNRKLAELYVLNLSDIPEMCNRNAAAANSVGRKDLVQLWSIAAIASHEKLKPSTDPDQEPWAFHPFGREMLQSLIKHYIGMKDVQTLAMLCCVFNSDPLPDQHRRTSRVKGDSESSYSSSGSPYQTIHPSDTSLDGWGNSVSFTLRRTSSWSEPLDCGFWADVQKVKQEKEKETHHANMRLLDPEMTGQYDAFKQIYANILYYWGLHLKRAEVLKFVSGMTEAHKGIEFHTLCLHCGKAIRGAQCSSCRNYGLRCAICHVAVKGPANFCLTCGHGGHTYHMMNWFSKQVDCPTGCGCKCQDANIFADEFSSEFNS